MSRKGKVLPKSPTIDAGKVFFIVTKAREFDAKVEPVEPDPGSNPSDDADSEILGDYADDPTLAELLAAIDGLDEDEQIELVALAWIGRGDFDRGQWREATTLAAERHNRRTGRYLVGIPNLGDCIEEGWSQFGRSLEEFEIGRL
jgi:Protein of unknown function (DUF3775)